MYYNMDNILNIKSFINTQVSLIPEIILFDNINFKCIDDSNQLDWINITNVTAFYNQKIYKSTITIDNNDESICIKAYNANSFLNSDGRTNLTYYTNIHNNIIQRMNSLRENYNYFTYTYDSSFIKSNVMFFNSNFLAWKNSLLNKYIYLDFIEYLDNYNPIRKLFIKSTFVNNLKLIVKILDIIKILIDNNLLHNDLGIYNVVTKGTDIDTIDIKIIDYENMIDLLDNTENIDATTKIYDIKASIYQTYEYDNVQLKDVNYYDPEDETNKPNIFCYAYQLDYLRLLSSFTEIYLNKPDFITIYNIIKHCVNNHLTVNDAKTHIGTIITSLENP